MRKAWLVCALCTMTLMSGCSVKDKVMELIPGGKEEEIIEETIEETEQETIAGLETETEIEAEHVVVEKNVINSEEDMFSESVTSAVMERAGVQGEVTYTHYNTLGLCDISVGDETIRYEPVSGRLLDEVSVICSNNVKGLSADEFMITEYVSAFALRNGYIGDVLVQSITGQAVSIETSEGSQQIPLSRYSNEDTYRAPDGILEVNDSLYYDLSVRAYYAEHGFLGKLDGIKIDDSISTKDFIIGIVNRNDVDWCMVVSNDGILKSGKASIDIGEETLDKTVLSQSILVWSAVMGNKSDITLVDVTEDSVTLKAGDTDTVLTRATGDPFTVNTADTLCEIVKVNWDCEVDEELYFGILLEVFMNNRIGMIDVTEEDGVFTVNYCGEFTEQYHKVDGEWELITEE